jgi:hypothetical protein
MIDRIGFGEGNLPIVAVHRRRGGEDEGPESAVGRDVE